MAYQQVGTPIFFINEPLWLLSNNSATITNNTGFPNNIFNLSPSTQYSNELAFEQENNIVVNLTNGYNYIAWLGHNLSDAQFRMHPKADGATLSADSGINYTQNSVPSYDGFTFQFFNQAVQEVDIYFFKAGETATVGKLCSISVGRYYEMPHSPDLNLTMTREYGGIKTIETKGGASLSNAFYTKPPAWGNLGAWEIGDYPESVKLGASGRRTWDLSFSYLDDGDVFGSNQHTGMSVWANEVTATDYESDDIDVNTGSYNKNIISDDNFYSQVIHKTNGGQLPFIFQPNKDDDTNFAICKFDQNSFSFQQTAPNLYSVKMKIREVW